MSDEAVSPASGRLLVFNLATDIDDPILGFTSAWLSALASRYEAVDVVTMRKGRLDLPANVSVFSVGKEAGYGEPRRLFVFYRTLRHLLAKHDYESCFAHMMPLFAVLSWPLLSHKKVPIVLWYVHRSKTAMLRLAEACADTVVSATADSFPLRSDKLVVTGHGIDVDLFTPGLAPLARPFIIVSVGRISPIKRLEVLIEAARALSEREGSEGLQVRLIGPVLENDHLYHHRLRELVERWDLQRAVHFVGPLSPEGVVEEYRSASVAVNLSDTDSLDKAFLEAMSCAVPVVTSNLACGRILTDVSPGSFVPKNDPVAVADACEAVQALSEEQREDLGARLRALVVKDHSLERLIARLSDELRSSAHSR